MKLNILEINSSNYGSTGNIMQDIAQEAKKKGHNVLTAVPNSRSNRRKRVANQLIISNRIERNTHLVLSYLTGYNGCYSIIGTKYFLSKVNEFKPDIIHLHNLHNCYINLPILFQYIKVHKIKTIWTLHDCWAFTGECPYFDLIGCEKWKTGCYNCPQYHDYPKSRIDQTRKMYQLKKNWFSGIDNMTIVTPSQWLANLVKQSYLKEYPVKVINNGIDLSIFQPRESDLRKRFKCENKTILLGVAFGWGTRKGLDIFIELAKQLPSNYQIILVGTDNEIDNTLPENIISIHRTTDQKELAEIYTAADIFLNPTREEVLGLVNLESLACGTPVITFNSGGSPECINNKTGLITSHKNVEQIKRAIFKMNETHLSPNDCIKRATLFDKKIKYKEYLELYEKNWNINSLS